VNHLFRDECRTVQWSRRNKTWVVKEGPDKNAAGATVSMY